MVGGQNPIEPAKFGCRIFYGPYVYNFQEIYDYLNTKNISEQIVDEKDLAEKIIQNFESPKKIEEKNINLLNNYGIKILNHTLSELNKLVNIKNENF